MQTWLLPQKPKKAKNNLRIKIKMACIWWCNIDIFLDLIAWLEIFQILIVSIATNLTLRIIMWSLIILIRLKIKGDALIN